jgi:hypothetical protein
VQAPVRDYARDHADVYGAVTAFQVLEHVVDPVGFLQGMISCVRPGGLVIVSVPAEDGALGVCVNDALNLPPHHMTRWTDRALTFVMTMIGLNEVELHHLSLNPEHRSEAVAQFLARAIAGSGFQNRLIRAGLVERILLALLTESRQTSPGAATGRRSRCPTAIRSSSAAGSPDRSGVI